MNRLFIRWMMLMLKYTYEIRREVLYANKKIKDVNELEDRGDEINEYASMMELLNKRSLDEKNMQNELDRVPHLY